MPVEVEVGNSEDHCGGRFPTKGITEGSSVAARVGACGGFPAAGIIVGPEVGEGILLGMTVVSSDGVPEYEYEYVMLPSETSNDGLEVSSEEGEGIRLGMIAVSSDGVLKYEYVILLSEGSNDGFKVGSELDEGIRLGMTVVSSDGVPKYGYVTLPSV